MGVLHPVLEQVWSGIFFRGPVPHFFPSRVLAHPSRLSPLKLPLLVLNLLYFYTRLIICPNGPKQRGDFMKGKFLFCPSLSLPSNFSPRPSFPLKLTFLFSDLYGARTLRPGGHSIDQERARRRSSPLSFPLFPFSSPFLPVSPIFFTE